MKTFAVALMLLMPFAPTHAQDVSHAAVIENISEQWTGYWNARNIKAIMTLYAPEPVFQTMSGERWDGAVSIRANFVKGLKLYEPRLTMQSVRSQASGNLGFDSGTFDEIASPTKGGKSVHMKGNYLFVFQRQKTGKWKILEQTWTAFDPAKL